MVDRLLDRGPPNRKDEFTEAPDDQQGQNPVDPKPSGGDWSLIPADFHLSSVPPLRPEAQSRRIWFRSARGRNLTGGVICPTD